MISPELIRRYSFFAELSRSQISALATVADELSVEAGHWFHHEGDELKKFHLIADGQVAIVMGVPDRRQEQPFANQIYNKLTTEDIIICTVGVGEMFGWSALIPPHKSTAGAKAATNSRVLTFDHDKLQPFFKQDCQFAYWMTLKAAQTIRERLRCLRIESLAHLIA